LSALGLGLTPTGLATFKVWRSRPAERFLCRVCGWRALRDDFSTAETRYCCNGPGLGVRATCNATNHCTSATSIIRRR